MRTMPSLFTRIIAGEIPGAFLFQDERWVAFLDIAPVAPGHVLLVPRHEAPRLPELPPTDLALMGPYLARLSTTVQKVTGAPSASILLREGPEAGQEIPHVHWHLIPRFEKNHAHHFAGGSYDSDAHRDDVLTKLIDVWNNG